MTPGMNVLRNIQRTMRREVAFENHMSASGLDARHCLRRILSMRSQIVAPLLALALMFPAPTSASGGDREPPSAVRIVSPHTGFATNAPTLRVVVRYRLGDARYIDRERPIQLRLWMDTELVGSFTLPRRTREGLHTFTVNVLTHLDAVVGFRAVLVGDNDSPTSRHQDDREDRGNEPVHDEREPRRTGDQPERHERDRDAIQSPIISVTLDKSPPSFHVVSPASGSTVHEPGLTVIGKVHDALSGVDTVLCDGTVATISSRTFTCLQTLSAGPNTIDIKSSDHAGNRANVRLLVNLETSSSPVHTLGHLMADPMTIPVGAATSVTIVMAIPLDPTLDPRGVSLERYDAVRDSFTKVGPMFDDGTHGDLVSGDNIFTAQQPFLPSAKGIIALRAAASFIDSDKPAWSQTLAIPAFVASTGDHSRRLLARSLRRQNLADAYRFLGQRFAANRALDGLDASAVRHLADALERCTVIDGSDKFQLCVWTGTTDGAEYRFMLIPDETGNWRVLGW